MPSTPNIVPHDDDAAKGKKRKTKKMEVHEKTELEKRKKKRKRTEESAKRRESDGPVPEGESKDDHVKELLHDSEDVQADPRPKKKKRDTVGHISEQLPPAPDPSSMFSLPSADALAAMFPSALENEDILRMFASADVSSVIQTLTDAASTGLPEASTSSAVAVAPPKKAAKSRKAKAHVEPLVSVTSPQLATNHSELLATTWLNTEQLTQLVREQGLVYKKGKFSTIEAQQVQNAIDNYKNSEQLTDYDIDKLVFPEKGQQKDAAFWTEITRAVPQRPIMAVYHFLRRSRNPLKQQGKWTQDEDARLIQAVALHGQAWEKVSGLVGRVGTDCRDRYRNYIVGRETRQHGPWTQEEEDQLTRIVLQVQNGKDLDYNVSWSKVAELMGGTRSRQQCRMKWTDSLYSRHKTNGLQVRWTTNDGRILISKIDALNVIDDTEIDWRALCDAEWNLFSPHILQSRWLTMKRSIQGYENMPHSDIMNVLRVKKVEHAKPPPSKRGKSGTGKSLMNTSDEEARRDSGAEES